MAAVAEPEQMKQRLDVVDILIEMDTPLESVALAVAVQPLASVTVTVYVPAVSDVLGDPVAPLLQLKVNVPVPPEPDAAI